MCLPFKRSPICPVIEQRMVVLVRLLTMETVVALESAPYYGLD